MANICKGLNTLKIFNCFQDNLGLISLVDAQRNLKVVGIFGQDDWKGGGCKELNNALARKANTINDLDLEFGVLIPPSILATFINLRKLSIRNFSKNTIREFQKYLAVSEFPDLQQLKIKGLPCFKEISLLIEKTQGNVLDVDINNNDAYFYFTNAPTSNAGMLIKAIANNCPRIEGLATYLGPKDFIHIKSLLLNCRCLKSICIDRSHNNNDIGDELLDILSKFSPRSLTSIKISGRWKYSIDAFERLFESCTERTLRCFDILYYDRSCITNEHRVIVEKYIDEGVIKCSNVINLCNINA